MNKPSSPIDLQRFIRDVPDFPKKGILFKDITPLLGDAAAFRSAIAQLADRAAARRPDVIVAIESRGFVFGSAVATTLGRGFVPVRKPGKLPFRSRRVEYALEYGTDALEMHEDAIAPGARVVVIDDLLATGGTAVATGELVRLAGGEVVGCAFVIELAFLGGRARLAPIAIDSLMSYA
jgi:adenine phosphoribosyltransferase